ncbi:MAG: hypothetical protein HYV60_14865 [Planctomycetia bacterium]|nr:hypothetical protein [Planctomycetia bacterium]
MKRSFRSLQVERLEARWAMDATAVGTLQLAAEGEGSPMADFHLQDVNPASARFGEAVGSTSLVKIHLEQMIRRPRVARSRYYRMLTVMRIKFLTCGTTCGT